MALINTDKENRGAGSGGPKKTGIMLGLSTIRRELTSLITLNFTFDLFLLPLIGAFLAWNLCDWPEGAVIAGGCILVFVLTMPAALTALSRITVTMVRDENYYLWPDFWKAWARNYGKSLLGGLVFFAGTGMLALAAYVYSRIFAANTFLLVIIFAFTACLALILLTAGFYYWPMLSYIELPFKALMKNSLILVLGSWKRSLRAYLCILAVLLVIGFWPSTAYDVLLILFLMIGISLFSLCMSFAVYPAIEEHVIRKAEEKAPSLATGLHSHEALKWEEELKSAGIEDLDFGPDDAPEDPIR